MTGSYWQKAPAQATQQKKNPGIQFAAMLLGVLACLLPADRQAAYGARPQTDCMDQALTTMDMVKCSEKRYHQAITLLDKRYDALEASLDEEGRGKLKTAQIAWLMYRDAQCGFEADRFRGGTLANVIALECMVKMTQNREDTLKKLHEPR